MKTSEGQKRRDFRKSKEERRRYVGRRKS